MGATSIEWTDFSINPIRARLKADPSKVGHYCEKPSSGCLNCYASRFQVRKGLPPFGGIHGRGREAVDVFLDPKHLEAVMRRQKPTRWFWEDMSDLFGEWVPTEFIDRCLAVMSLTPQHTHQVLTKRAQRMAEYFSDPDYSRRIVDQAFNAAGMDAPRGSRLRKLVGEGLSVCIERDNAYALGAAHPGLLPNVWLGVSVEDQQRADERIPLLLQCPAAVRFLSCEPLLGPLELSDVTNRADCVASLGKPAMRGIGWVICGGESGPGARPMHPEWARSLRNQCVEAGVPYFFKQWGVWAPFYERDKDDPDWRYIPNESPSVTRINLAGGQGFHGAGVTYFRRVNKKRAGRLLDGREWSEMPEAPRG